MFFRSIHDWYFRKTDVAKRIRQLNPQLTFWKYHKLNKKAQKEIGWEKKDVATFLRENKIKF